MTEQSVEDIFLQLLRNEDPETALDADKFLRFQSETDIEMLVKNRDTWELLIGYLQDRDHTCLSILPLLNKFFRPPAPPKLCFSVIHKFEFSISCIFKTSETIASFASWSTSLPRSLKGAIRIALRTCIQSDTHKNWARELKNTTYIHFLFYFSLAYQVILEEKDRDIRFYSAYIDIARNVTPLHHQESPINLLVATLRTAEMIKLQVSPNHIFLSFSQYCCDWSAAKEQAGTWFKWGASYESKAAAASNIIREILTHEVIVRFLLSGRHPPSEQTKEMLEMLVTRFIVTEKLKECIQPIVELAVSLYQDYNARFEDLIDVDGNSMKMKIQSLLGVVSSLLEWIVRRIVRAKHTVNCAQLWTLIGGVTTQLEHAATSTSRGVSESADVSLKRLLDEVVLRQLVLDDDFLVEAPVKFVRRLPLNDSLGNRRLLFKYLTGAGKKLGHGCLKSHKDPGVALDGLEDLLDGYFSNLDSFRKGEFVNVEKFVAGYLEPFTVLLNGASSQIVGEKSRNNVLGAGVRATALVLSMLLRCRKYGMLDLGSASEEFWMDVRVLFRDKVLAVLPVVAVMMDSRSFQLDASSFDHLAGSEQEYMSTAVLTSATTHGLPPLYALTTAAFGDVLFRVCQAVEIRKDHERALDQMLRHSLRLFPSESRKKLSGVCSSFCANVLRCTLDSLNSHQFETPKSLQELPVIFTFLRSNAFSGEYFFLESYIEQLRKPYYAIENALTASLVAFAEDRVTRTEINFLLTKSDYLYAYESVVRAFQLDAAGMSTLQYSHVHSLQTKFHDANDERESLQSVITFLTSRNLLPPNTVTVLEDLDNVKLNDLIVWNFHTTAVLRLPQDTLQALFVFSKGSLMFASRFDEDRRAMRFRDTTEEIVSRTKSALSSLQQLVNGEAVRISDFKLNLSNVLVELQQRRRATVAEEMARVATFFASENLHVMGDEDVLEMNLERLNAALTLLRYRDEFPAFRNALIELELVTRAVNNAIEESPAIQALHGDFLLSEAPMLLRDIQRDIEQLTYWHITLIGKLQLAGLFLSFLRRFGDGLESGGYLERAQNRASNNEHAARVLMKLLPLRDMLRPFYTRSFRTLKEIRVHLEQYVQEKPDDKNEEPTILTELLNVADNWAIVEIYFRDGFESGAAAGDVERLVARYLSTGQYVSTVGMQPNLSFTYRLKDGNSGYLKLAPELLQEQVQCAVLGMGSSAHKAALEEFVTSYHMAERAHAVRILLEKAGHPGHQYPTSHTSVLADTVSVSDLEASRAMLADTLERWRESVSRAKAQSPRLLLLTHKARLQFILACRRQSNVSAEVLPYVMQCFPTMMHRRHVVLEAIELVLTSLDVTTVCVEESLDFAADLLVKVEGILAADATNDVTVVMAVVGNPDGLDEEKVSCMNLRGASMKSVYCEHLADMISISRAPAQPGMVIWGDAAVTNDHIQELLAVSSVPLCRALHVVSVERLSASVREALLRGLQSITLRCPILLIFGEQEGSDAFAQFDTTDPQSQLSSALVRNLWCGTVHGGHKSKAQVVNVWVVTGAVGCGKSKWIEANAKAVPTRFVIHEGFSPCSIIQEYLAFEKLKKRTGKKSTISFHFDVTAYADFPVFSRFLHFFLSIGLLLDEETGQSAAIMPNTDIAVYVELPSVLLNSVALGEGDAIWPANTSTFNATKHPFLDKYLPVLSVTVPANHFVAVTASEPYMLDAKARLVACYAHLYETLGDRFGTHPLPAEVGDGFPDDQAADALERLFRTTHVNESKRVRSNFVAALHQKILYFLRIQTEIQNEVANDMQFLSARFLGSDPSAPIRGAYRRLFELFVKECVTVSNDDIALPDVLLFSILAPYPADFEILIITSDTNLRAYRDLCEYFLNSKRLCLAWGNVPNEIRAQVAPSFGMSDTGDFLSALHDCGHLLTADSLVRILHLNARRSLGMSVIYEGETGVGKSQNLHLYSFLVNKDSSLFTNLKLHLVAVMKAIAKTKVNDPRFLEQAVESNVNDNMLNLPIGDPVETVIQTALAWVREDPLPLANELGCAICCYFCRLFLSYPLHLEGLSTAAKSTLRRYELEFAVLEEFAGPAVLVAMSAEMEPFLPLRPLGERTTNSDQEVVDMTEDESFTEGEIHHVLTEANDDVEEDFEVNEEEDTEVNTLPPLPQANAQPQTPLFGSMADLRDFLHQLLSASPVALYHRILADESLTASRWRDFLHRVCETSQRLKRISSKSVVCVFVDELNTAGCLGMISEAFTSHSVDGKRLPSNLFLVGAINPLRTNNSSTIAMPAMDFTKSSIGPKIENEESDYLAGIPYIVQPMSPSMLRLRVLYPNSSQKAELAFLEEYFRQHVSVTGIRGEIDPYVWEYESFEFFNTATRLIARAQTLVSGYRIPRVFMSIRNLVRVSKILQWLLDNSVPTARDPQGENIRYKNIFLPAHVNTMNNGSEAAGYLRQALIISISVTYMFQLPSAGHVDTGRALADFRTRFLQDIAREWSTIEHRPQELIEYEIREVLTESLNHLWSYASIPYGIAPTTALKENFYCNVLATSIPISLLITGPPGCGKTLSFSLASSNMKGPCLNHSIAFQSLKKIHKFPYQCSADSNGAEIVALCTRALEQQEVLDRFQPGRHMCVVFMDEVGLPPERRQALKALHDVLEKPVVATVMMSNTTLDAAKTSRCIQLLQTQANIDDLFELAKGILLYGSEDDIVVNVGDIARRDEAVRGLCRAFQTMSEVVRYDNWFHVRDFVFTCRFLRRRIDVEYNGIPPPGLFTADMLLSALRRNFQPVNPVLFGDIAKHFLVACNLLHNLSGKDVDMNMDAQVVGSLRDSLSDLVVNHTDPTSAHCRYSMVVDPTDSEVAVDLLFALKLLDHSTTRLVSVSDFQDDCTPTRRTAVLARVKEAVETGLTLLLVNSGPLQSALYDVINRHYAISISETGAKEAYASIALGSFSRYVRVHPSFRLVVHVAASQLGRTPLPFLNRLEKFTLSIRDALCQRIQDVAMNPPLCLRSVGSAESRTKLFQALIDGVSDFVRFSGGHSAFYGLVENETVPALVLRALDDACSRGGIEFEISTPLYLQRDSSVEASLQRKNEDGDEDGVEESKGSCADDGEYGMDIDEDPSTTPDDNDLQGATYGDTTAPASTRLRYLIKQINFQVLQMGRLEAIYKLRDRLPASYVREYVEGQEHLTVTNFIQRMLRRVPVEAEVRLELDAPKVVVYTRTDARVLRLASDPSFALNCFVPHGSSYTARIVPEFGGVDDRAADTDSDTAILWIVPLAVYSSANTCSAAIKACLTRGRKFMLLVVADMKRCSPAQVTHARHVVDEVRGHGAAGEVTCTVIFLIHVPAELLQMTPCYQTVPIQGWLSVYADSFSDGRNDSLDIRDSSSAGDWMKVAFGLDDLPSIRHTRNEFHVVAQNALRKALLNCRFRIGRPKSFFDNLDIQSSRACYERGDLRCVFQLFEGRSYLTGAIVDMFTQVWGRLLSRTVHEACDRVSKGLTSRGVLDCIRTKHVWLLSDFMLTLVSRDLAANWGLEALFSLPEGTRTDYTVTGEEVTLSDEASNLAKCTLLILQSITVLSDFSTAANASRSVTAGVNCSRVNWVPRTPLFYTFQRCLSELVEEGVRAARVEFSSLSSTCMVVRDEASIHGRLRSTKKWRALSSAVFFIENCPKTWERFVQDFMCVDLGLSAHAKNPEEFSVLQIHANAVICRTFPAKSSTVAAEERSNIIDSSSRSVVQWRLLTESLRAETTILSQLLLKVRGVLPIEDLVKIANAFHHSTSSQEAVHASDYLEPELDTHKSSEVCLPDLLIQTVGRRLWTVLLDLAQQCVDIESPEDGDSSDMPPVSLLDTWMCCMRDLNQLKAFKNDSLCTVILLVYKYLCHAPKQVLRWGLQALASVLQALPLSRGPVHCTMLVLATLMRHPQTQKSLSDTSSSVTCFVTETLRTMVSSKNCLQSSCGPVIVSGLLGMGISSAQALLSDTFEDLGVDTVKGLYNHVFASLSVSVRAELLRSLYVLDEDTVNTLLELFLSTSILNLGSSHGYLPVTVLVSLTAYAGRNVYPTDFKTSEVDNSLKFMSDEHSMVFNVMLFFQCNRADDKSKGRSAFEAALSNFRYLFDENSKCNSNVMSKMKLAASTVAFLDAVALSLSQMDASIQPSVHLGNDVVNDLRVALQPAPCAWSTYLLSQLQDISIITKILHDGRMLTALGVPWWHVTELIDASEARMSADGDGLEALRRQRLELHSRICAVRHAAAMVDYQRSSEGHRAPTVSIVANADLADLDPQVRLAADVVQLLVNQEICTQLACNQYIPICAEMFQFALDMFPYRFTEDQTMTLTFEDAMESLPPPDRRRGRHLFQRFLLAWESLRRVFETFDQCHREAVAAAPIPELTKKDGAHPVMLSYLIEFASNTVHESGLARILESRLLKQTRDILNHPSVLRLRWNESFNRDAWLLRKEPTSLDVSSLMQMPSLSRSLLLTGAQSDARSTAELESVCCTYSRWRVTSAVPIIPLEDAHVDTVDIRRAFDDQADAAARVNQTLAHEANMVICPRCHQLGERISGCDHLVCGGTNGPYGGGVGVRGCGTAMNFNQHRVPMPVPGQPLHPWYRPARVAIPEHLLQMPPLPAIKPVEGHYEIDWVSIAYHLMSSVIANRPELTVEVGDGLFRPLPLYVPDMGSGDSDEFDIGVSSNCEKSPLNASIAVSGADRGADVRTRLRQAAQHLRCQLQQHIPNFGTHNTLSDTVFKRVQSLLLRSEEVEMESQFDQLLILTCLASRQWDAADPSEFKSLQQVTVGEAMTQLQSSDSSYIWSTSLLKTIRSVALKELPFIIDMLLSPDLDSMSSKWPMLCASLPSEDTGKVEAIFSSLLENVASSDTPSYRTRTLTQLQSLGSLLLNQVDALQSMNEFGKLRDVSWIADQLRIQASEADSLLRRLCQTDVVRVRHVGVLLRLIRRTIGQLSDIVTPAMMRNSSQSAVDTKPESNSAASNIRDELSFVYKELIPENWEAIQQVVDIDDEDITTASQLLKGKSVDDSTRESIGDEIEGGQSIDTETLAEKEHDTGHHSAALELAQIRHQRILSLLSQLTDMDQSNACSGDSRADDANIPPPPPPNSSVSDGAIPMHVATETVPQTPTPCHAMRSSRWTTEEAVASGVQMSVSDLQYILSLSLVPHKAKNTKFGVRLPDAMIEVMPRTIIEHFVPLSTVASSNWVSVDDVRSRVDRTVSVAGVEYVLKSVVNELKLVKARSFDELSTEIGLSVDDLRVLTELGELSLLGPNSSLEEIVRTLHQLLVPLRDIEERFSVSKEDVLNVLRSSQFQVVQWIDEYFLLKSQIAAIHVYLEQEEV